MVLYSIATMEIDWKREEYGIEVGFTVAHEDLMEM
jgi:hypothetical protein